ncbi:hypothetical protein CTI12_AA367650 [Artemisia annua]|uniref:Uncharacterized protein n=1 Tax=Artemisia annua TaxID=35608 RepID=A0A2U1MLT3_ARTAN|nr:hypothetical protein CTI12_AA367650 [Artemisia annua]
MARVEGFCRNQKPLAENQKSEGHCVYIAMADMAGTTIPMISGTTDQQQLSPMPMVDRHLLENEYVAEFVCNNLSLETRDDYPYEHQSRHRTAWKDRKYRARGHRRYYLTRICHESHKWHIKTKLINHFLGDRDDRNFQLLQTFILVR